MAKKIIIALLGLTKSGKTTFLSTLVKLFKLVLYLCSGNEKRTKTIMDFHLVNYFINGLFVEDIVLKIDSFLGSRDSNSRKKFNEKIETHSILKNIFKLEPFIENTSLNEDENAKLFEESITTKLDEFKKSLVNNLYDESNIKEIKNIINSEYIDIYIRKITIKMTASDEIKNYIEDSNIDLFCRDTRGLLDIAIEDEKDNKKTVNIPSLSDLGLDKLDAAIFFANDEYPEIVSSLYKDTFEKVFKSIPFFIMARDSSMFKIFNREISVSNIDKNIDEIQSGTNPSYNNFEDEYFLTTLKLLSNFGIVEQNKSAYNFIDGYFSQSKREFLIPQSSNLKKFSIDNTIDLDEDNFKFFKLVSEISFIKVLKMVYEFNNRVDIVKNTSLIRTFITNEFFKNLPLLIKDINNFDNHHNSSNASVFMKPQLTYVSKKFVENFLSDTNAQIIGPRGGITTMKNGRLKYAETAIMSVTVYNFLYYLIDSIEIISDLVDDNNHILFPSLEKDIEKQSIIFKKIIRNLVYKNITDINANIQNYLICDRYIIKNSILKFRETNLNFINELIELSIKEIIKKL